MCSASLGIDGYILERDNLCVERCRTQTALYISVNLNYVRRKDLEIKASPMIWIEVNKNTPSAWLLFVGYREWRSLLDKDKDKSVAMDQQLERLLKWKESWLLAEAEGKPMYAMGDMNIDVRPWTQPLCTITKYQEAKKSLLSALRQMAAETAMEIIATDYTRKQGGNQISILDILLTNVPATIAKATLHKSSSDHKIVVYEKTVTAKLKEPNIRRSRSFKVYTKERMIAQLQPDMINSLLDVSDTNLVANVLIGHITEALDIIAPIKSVQPRFRYAPYLTSTTKKMMTERDDLKETAHKSGKSEDFIIFKKAKNLTLKNQRKDKLNWALRLIEPKVKDGRKLWKTVKNISRAKQANAIDKLTIDGVIVTKKKDMANGLNVFFVNKVKKLVADLPPPTIDLLRSLRCTETVKVPQMELKEIRMQDLRLLMKGVKKTPAAGLDGISGIVIHDIFETIKHALLHLLNLSQCSGIFPEVCKMTKIIPIVKAGKDPLLPSSFRPVSNISTIGKLIEKGVMNQVEHHLATHNLTNKDQHGGRKAHSTTTCLTEILEDAKGAQEKKNYVALVAVDLTAAYEMVNHDILWEKCRILNFDKNTLQFLRSFLATRSQLIEIDGTRSSPLMTGGQGVVQGGPSSGLLFNIYINDLPDQVNGLKQPTTSLCSTEKQYVDDGTIVVRGKNIRELKKNIIRDYIGVRDYLVNHRMVINGSKTQLTFLKPHPDPDELFIELEGTIIRHQPNIKILGVTISDDWKFEEHVWKGNGSITRNINCKASLMRTLKPYLPLHLLCQVGNSIINSTIMYCAPIWGPSSQANRAKVQKAQIKAARIITGKWSNKNVISHRQELLTSIKWPNVDQLITMSSLNLLKNAIAGQSSKGLEQMFKITEPRDNARRLEARIDHKGLKTRPDSIFSANTASLFNNLPSEIKYPGLTVRQFKRLVKEHTMANYALVYH